MCPSNRIAKKLVLPGGIQNALQLSSMRKSDMLLAGQQDPAKQDSRVLTLTCPHVSMSDRPDFMCIAMTCTVFLLAFFEVQIVFCA